MLLKDDELLVITDNYANAYLTNINDFMCDEDDITFDSITAVLVYKPFTESDPEGMVIVKTALMVFEWKHPHERGKGKLLWGSD